MTGKPHATHGPPPLGTPQVSVIIPAYNAAGWASRAIDSVLAQDYPRLDVVVVDDGSTDATGDVCRGYGDRIRYLRQDNAGVSVARNRGIAEARGELVCFLDADDEYLPGHVATLAGALGRHPEAGLACGAFRVTDGQRLRHRSARPTGGAGREEWTIPRPFRDLARGLFVWTGSLMARREAFDEVGVFPVGAARGQDLHMWTRLIGRFPCVYVDRELALYHKSPRTTSLRFHGGRRNQLPIGYLFREEEMRRRIDRRHWPDYRIWRRDRCVFHCLQRLARGGSPESLRKIIGMIPPAPASPRRSLAEGLLRLPDPWLACAGELLRGGVLVKDALLLLRRRLRG